MIHLAPQGLKYPAPYADQLESMEDKQYQRVTIEEARRGTPRKLFALCNYLLPHTYSNMCYVLLSVTEFMAIFKVGRWSLCTVMARNIAYVAAFLCFSALLELRSIMGYV